MWQNVEGTKDKDSLQSSLKEMENTVEKIDNQLFLEDNKMRILEIESSLNWHRGFIIYLFLFLFLFFV